MDKLTKAQRSDLMSRIHSGNTKPEWILRCALHRLGYRYTVNNRHLPGRPDLVLPKYRTAIFVHGCFWHQHPGCPSASSPSSNTAFWQAKFAKNVARDARNALTLRKQGWNVLVLWECELVKHTLGTIEHVLRHLECAAGTGSGTYDGGGTDTLTRLDLLHAAEDKVQYRIRRHAQRRASDKKL